MDKARENTGPPEQVTSMEKFPVSSPAFRMVDVRMAKVEKGIGSNAESSPIWIQSTAGIGAVHPEI
jgi:hypothetical protein